MPSQSFLNRAMTIAASENNMEDTATAINMGADPNYVDEHGFTAALYFADYGNLDGVVMVYTMAKEKLASSFPPPGNPASQTLQVNRHKVSPVLMFAQRGDIDAVLKLGQMEPAVLNQPVFNNLLPNTGINIDKVAALLKAGFVADDKFAPNMAKFNISTSDLLAHLGEAA